MIMKNLVLIGHGYWGRNLERVIQKNKNLFNLVGIVDTKYENKISRNVAYFDSLKSVVESKVKVDCAVISTPATEHYKITKTALQNNIHCKILNLNKSEWLNVLRNVKKNLKKINFMKKNAFILSKKYTYKKRAELLLRGIK